MADYGGSTTRPETRDQTQTPLWLFRALDQEYNFTMDAACMHNTTLVPECYLTPYENSLSVNWAEVPHTLYADTPEDYYGDHRVWLNPPYSDIDPWVRKAHRESLRGITTVMLLPMDATARWWAAGRADEIRIITGYYDGGRWRSGRIDFIDTNTGKEIKGNPKGSCFIIFNSRPGASKDDLVDTRTVYVSKKDLITQGGNHPATLSDLI